MGDDSSPLIAALFAIAIVVSVLAGGSVMAGDALAGIMPWRGNRALRVARRRAAVPHQRCGYGYGDRFFVVPKTKVVAR